MKEVDYIIVGDGYAALFTAHQMLKAGKRFLLYSEGKEGASRVSAGIINPVVLKKFTTFWLAQEQIAALRQTLAEITGYTGGDYYIGEPIHRIFHDEKEKDLWLRKAGNDELAPFLTTDFVQLPDIHNPFGAGRVDKSARLEVGALFNDFMVYLKDHGHLREERFDYMVLKPEDSTYLDITYEKLVFCEGMAVINNPYFSAIPVVPNKGHYLKVRLSVPLVNPFTLKKKHFLFPLDDGCCYYGGTYDRFHRDTMIDDSAREELVKGLRELYPHDFEVVDIKCGFRPTVKDRRPILGSHPVFPSLYVFNGLGARGILNGNYFAAHLFQHMENTLPLLPEVDLNRFEP